MAEFLAAYPDYAATARLDELRATEYSYLDAGGHTYLDYTGAGLAADAQLRAHVQRLRSGCFGNPHSENPASRASTALVEQAREAVLGYFNARSGDYAVIFTPNATGACRLVGEAYRFRPRSRLVLTADNHNSVHGLREFARAHHAAVRYVKLSPADLRTADEDVSAALGRGTGLFGFPAQSNFSGVQHPLAWVDRAQAAGYDVLLDAAAFVPTNRLDLAAVKPEFVAVSWYKVFGYPTGIGCLLARRDALARLRRPWFSGGTVVSASAQGGWYRLAEDESGFEDGTLNFLSIPDVTTGLAWISDIGIDLIHRRVGYLTSWLLQGLAGLKHGSGAPMVRLYGPGPGPADGGARGGTVAFNFLDPRGAVVDERAVARDASAVGISVRTGCFCNPGAGEWAFGLTQRRLRQIGRRRSARQELRTPEDFMALTGLPSGGAVRVSLGLVSTIGDVERFLDFAEQTYCDREPDCDGLAPRVHC